MRHSIATVSLSGRLEHKLAAAAGAGFDGIELFDNDLVASTLSPREVAARCADLGLAVELFQPVRDVEGVAPDGFGAVRRRFAAKLDVMEQLGTSVVLCCSNASPDALDDPDLSAEQLAALGDLAAERGVTIAYEALAWGRHVSRFAQSWDVVRRADHPSVTVAVDTFHLLARGDGPEVLAGVPGDRIGFLQVADAPLLRTDLLEWSRHFRCFPGQGGLDVTGVVAATVAAGYDGPLSLEVFSDVVREAPPEVTARDARRSLIFLESELGESAAPLPDRVDAAFVEVPAGHEDLLTALGFVEVGRHRSKPVTRWRNGAAEVVVNRAPTDTALGVVVPSVPAVAARARALLWPEVDRSRGAGEAQLPGITSPSGLHVFVSAPDGADDWIGDFAPTGTPPAGDWGGLDHLGVAVPEDRLNEEIGFLRTVLGMVPAAVEEFIEPRGRLRSRAVRPSAGDLRVVLNVEHAAGADRSGVTQVAFACADVRAAATALRERGVPLLEVPGNYYVDLAARFDLTDAEVDDLRRHGLFYDRSGGGELVHLYTEVLPTGFYVELLQREGGYDGYGSAGTHVRLAAQQH
ncbi:sugar phosphate isomerase/epimerase and 4-hydroxyphenylpyruvate domain-containing protein [Nocardioides zeae]|uniref:3-dehydroshikimate dehydratase n=1 Tax=Nocardioides zeae TaxID=1457234 RepID=A0A6P0HNK6_9ACTN|nr:sugar phosphate isomerase/epimerase and 4-hydroxyphenylpyruvate domain-containing protein [Nocardioides zeae]NEN79880.1 sugar phosphate isomerase/epimerase and 4-hydroxyphenylpyruvate domain-containing protein [Nocardioides zeae]